MELGRHLRELARLRFGAAVCVVIAGLAATSLTHKISIFPPGLESRSLQMASAATEVLVDTQTSVLLDLSLDTKDIESLTNRAVLLGNVMASAPVREYIGRRAGVPGDLIRTVTPRTPNSPRPFETAETKKKVVDLVASTAQYRLNIEANPTVPVLKVYAQAPTARSAADLANGAVDGLRDYLAQAARVQGIDASTQVRIQQLGRARGTVINHGISRQVAALAFMLFFAAAAAAAIFVSRVRQGFRLAGEQDRRAAARRAEARLRASVDDRDLVAP